MSSAPSVLVMSEQTSSTVQAGQTRQQNAEMGAYALGGRAVGGAGGITGGEVAALAALDNLELGAGLGGDGSGNGGAEAVALEQGLSDRL